MNKFYVYNYYFLKLTYYKLTKMLNFWLLKQLTINYLKNNWFFDYILKMYIKLTVYNILIYLGFFFAEKYLIEYNTKYVFVQIYFFMHKFFKIITISNIYIYIFN